MICGTLLLGDNMTNLGSDETKPERRGCCGTRGKIPAQVSADGLRDAQRDHRARWRGAGVYNARSRAGDVGEGCI